MAPRLTTAYSSVPLEALVYHLTVCKRFRIPFDQAWAETPAGNTAHPAWKGVGADDRHTWMVAFRFSRDAFRRGYENVGRDRAMERLAAA